MEDLMTAYLYLLICLVFDGLHVWNVLLFPYGHCPKGGGCKRLPRWFRALSYPRPNGQLLV